MAWALEGAGIIVNRNTVPNETASPFYPSGLRMGTPALTVRGMKETEMEKIGGWIDEVVKEVGEVVLPDDKEERQKYLNDFRVRMETNKKIAAIKKEVETLCLKFPVPEL